MKSIYSVFFSVITCAVLTACSSDDNNIQIQQFVESQASTSTTQTYTLTLNASKGGGSTTRALADNGNIVSATWEVGEEVSVFNVTRNVALEGTLKAETVGATTTLSGKLTGNIGVNEQLRLSYMSANYNNQEGTLDYIANNCDYATALVTVSSIGANNYVMTTTDASFVNQQAIVKFTLKNSDGSATLNVSQLVIGINNNTIRYVVTPALAMSTMYVAIPSFTTGNLSMTAVVEDVPYVFSKSGVIFDNGTFYRINVKTTEAPNLEALKTVVNAGTDCSSCMGFYVKETGEITTGSTDAIGRLAYSNTSDVETAMSGSRILVLGLTNVGNYAWKSSATSGESAWNSPTTMNGLAFCQSHNTTVYPAAYQAYNWTTSKPSGSSNWFLPSYAQWNNMRCVAVMSGDGQLENGSYWSAREVWNTGQATTAWSFIPNSNGSMTWNPGVKNTTKVVRACFAY